MRWQEEALCEGGTIDDISPTLNFFEGYEKSLFVAEWVDELCYDCPVKMMCLVNALKQKDYPPTGVFGGIYLNLGHYDKQMNSHKPPEQRKREEEMVKSIRREIRAGNV